MQPSAENLHNFLRLVVATAPREIDCDKFLESASCFLETVQVGRPLAEELKETAQHLEVCPECKEEFEALLELYDIRLNDSSQ